MPATFEMVPKRETDSIPVAGKDVTTASGNVQDISSSSLNRFRPKDQSRFTPSEHTNGARYYLIVHYGWAAVMLLVRFGRVWICGAVDLLDQNLVSTS